MKLLAIFLSVFLAAFAYEQPLPNGAQEAAAQKIFRQLRCVVCDGEPLSSSDADFSRDMRALIREQIARGNDEARVMKFMTDRYGSAILQAPPASGATLWLWLFPLLVLGFGAAKIIAAARAKKVANSGNDS